MTRPRFVACVFVGISVACGGSTPSAPTSGPTATPAPSPGWQAARVLAMDDALQLHLAGNGKGGAVALWTTPGGALRVAELSTASGWGPVESLAHGLDAGTYSSPDVAFSPSGVSIVVWRALDSRIYTRRRGSSSESWGAAVKVEEGPHFPEPAHVGIDDAGDAVITWISTPGGAWLTRFQASGWQAPTLLVPGWFLSQSLAVGARGLATIVVFEGCGAQFQISGPLVAEVDCIEPGSFSVELTKAGSDGRVLAVGNGAEAVAWTSWWLPSAGWTKPTPLGSSPGNGFALDVDGGGNAFVLVSIDREGHIWAHRFEPDGGWRPPVDLATSGAPRVRVPSIALDQAGSGWAAWIEYVPAGGIAVVARHFVIGSGWAPPEVVNEVGFTPGYCAVVGDGHGGAVIVWSELSPDRTAFRVMARQYVAG